METQMALLKLGVSYASLHPFARSFQGCSGHWRAWVGCGHWQLAPAQWSAASASTLCCDCDSDGVVRVLADTAHFYCQELVGRA